MRQDAVRRREAAWGPAAPLSRTYWHSGANAHKHFRLAEEAGAAVMVNARCIQQPRVIQGIEAHPSVPVVLDSGAFQGASDVGAYAETLLWCEERFPGRVLWAANLDVIGDQAASNANYLDLRRILYRVQAERGQAERGQAEQGQAAPPVLWVYQAEDRMPEHIDFMRSELGLAAGSLIGVGGLVPIGKRSTSDLLSRIELIGRALERNQLRGHFFGVGAHSVLSAVGAAAWFASADSQKWTAGLKARKLYRGDGSSILARRSGLQLTPHECARQNLRQIQGWMEAGQARGGQEPGGKEPRARGWPDGQRRSRFVARAETPEQVEAWTKPTWWSAAREDGGREDAPWTFLRITGRTGPCLWLEAYIEDEDVQGEDAQVEDLQSEDAQDQEAASPWRLAAGTVRLDLSTTEGAATATRSHGPAWAWRALLALLRKTAAYEVVESAVSSGPRSDRQGTGQQGDQQGGQQGGQQRDERKERQGEEGPSSDKRATRRPGRPAMKAAETLREMPPL